MFHISIELPSPIRKRDAHKPNVARSPDDVVLTTRYENKTQWLMISMA